MHLEMIRMETELTRLREMELLSNRRNIEIEEYESNLLTIGE